MASSSVGGCAMSMWRRHRPLILIDPVGHIAEAGRVNEMNA